MLRTFSGVYVHGLDRLEDALRQGPVLVVSNHTAWWDPLVAIVLCTRVLSADAYAMMDARNLRRLPFFRKVGAFGVDRDDPNDGARAIRYAAKLLGSPGRLVWIFAQGEEVPITAKALGFKPGAAEVARVARHAATLPLALRYEFGEEEKPRLLVSVGERMAFERNVQLARVGQERAVAAELARIDDAVLARNWSAFVCIRRAQPSWLARTAERCLAGLSRLSRSSR